MSRVGWVVLGLILAVGTVFAMMTSFGGGHGTPRLRSTLLASRSAESAPPPTGMLAVPVAGVARTAVADNYGDPRDGGARSHHGIDIMAAGGTPVVAAASGRVEKLFESHAGGTTIYVRSPDGRWSYYYAHLAGYAPGLHEGQQVRAGETIGRVGDSGNAGAGNYHLHFGLSRMADDDGWEGGRPVNPYPLLAGSAPRR
ncbi:hypothetical protein GCM10011380_24640 [Sphingomonas metalli]|uniref:M23ase beta-sheet core domain-containing protein n=1 Tax=Sphingomonas metalli TaxID=1779358 RepID=A0A916T798_9SPHN|nr:M23 family metallopeptidase [Sphingomonas metalli]GGB34277.1 hypothetical protein GCM10011380_24640 [Sphingomonas metalli]